MKKWRTAALAICITVVLAACASAPDQPKMLDKEGIAPYEMTESEQYILQSYGMEGTSQLISFHAPKEAITINLMVYRLNDDGAWSSTFEGGISIGAEREPIDQLIGTFAMQLKENHSIALHFNAGGLYSYQTDEIMPDLNAGMSFRAFLQEYQSIELNTELPVALMVYDGGTSMKSFTLQDYFEPSKLDGMDLVQVVTLEFSDQSLSEDRSLAAT